jgi:hypothetical protein
MYSVAVDVARQHSYEIATKALGLINQAKLSQAWDLNMAQRFDYLQTNLKMQLRYLETGNIKEWQNYIHQDIQANSQRGLDYTQVIKRGQLLLTALEQFYQEKLPSLGNTIQGVPISEYLHSLERRIVGLNMVATTAAIASGLSQLK